jgi:hypothetical protein
VIFVQIEEAGLHLCLGKAHQGGEGGGTKLPSFAAWTKDGAIHCCPLSTTQAEV